MGDVRFSRLYARLRSAPDLAGAILTLPDEDVVAALAGAAREQDPYLANVLATEAMNRARRWTMVFGRLDEGIVTLRPSGTIRSANPRAAELLGEEPDALQGRALNEAVRTRPSGVAEDALRRALEDRVTAHAFAECLLRPDDERAPPVEMSITPMLRDEEVEGAVLVLRDVSEREEAARRILESEQRYRSLFVHNSDPVLAVDAGGAFVSVNPAAERVFGRRARELIGMPLTSVLLPEDRDKALDAFARALTGTAVALDVGLLRPDRVRTDLDVVVLPITVANRVEGVYVLARDVTRRRRAEADLRRRQRVLADLAREQALHAGDLAAMMHRILTASADAVDVARVSYWTYDPDTRKLSLERFHARAGGSETIDAVDAEVAPEYLRALETERVVAAHDAQEDPRTCELAESYLAPRDITSLLDAPVRIEGRLVGVLCHEHVGRPRTWSVGEQEFAAAAADLVSMAIGADQRRRDMERLRGADRRLRLLLDHVPMILFALDEHGTYTRSEGSALEVFRMRSEEFVGRSIFAVVGDNPGIVASARRALAGESFTSVDHVNGHTFQTRWMPVKDDAGRTKEVLAVALDVTQTQRAMAELRESEERFRTLADAAVEAILIHQDGRVVDANRALLELKGYTRDEIVGMNILDLIVPEERDHIMQRVAQGGDLEYDTVGLARDGERIPIRIRSRPVQYCGAAARVVALHDIREQRGLEQDLAQQVTTRTKELGRVRDHLHGILEAAGEGICGLDGAGRVVFVNGAGARMLRLDPETAIGRRFHDTVHSADGPECECPIRASYQKGEVHRVEDDVFLRDDGTTFPVAYTSTPLMEEGRPAGAVIVFQETTERRRSQQEMRALNEELGRRVAQLGNANRELEAFSYSVSHDLRAPLRGVDFFAQVLEEDHAEKLDDEGRRIVASLRGETRRLTQLVEDLLTLAQANSGELELRKVDLTRLAHEQTDDLRRQDPDRDVEVHVEEGLSARADEGLVRVALANLLQNAWKYTKHSEPARIEVGRAEKEGGTAFYVRDNGIGFPAAEAARLFRPFERLPGAANFPGTGVGLSTVRRIVERHGGRVWAEGRPGEGATFWFTLPDPPAPSSAA